MSKKICFDLDGTLANLYAVNGWLEMLRSENPTPYEIAEPMLNMSSLARLLHKAQRYGYEIVIISWASMNASDEYLAEIERAKREWLRKHLPSVVFDEIIITEYGVPKHEIASGVLFDDNDEIRAEWGSEAYEPSEILDFLREIGTTKEIDKEILSWLK